MAIWGPDAPPPDAPLSIVIAQPLALRWYDIFLLPLGAAVVTSLAGASAVVLDWHFNAPGGVRLAGWWVTTSSMVWFAYLAQVALYAGFILSWSCDWLLLQAWFPRAYSCWVGFF